MIKTTIFILLITSLTYGDLLFEINQSFQTVLNKIPEIQGECLKIEPLPDQGGSLINSVYLVKTTAGEELILKVENAIWEKKKTLNEVASIRYLQKHSTIPVPYIYYYESNIDQSPFSAEFILMNKIKGRPLNLEIERIYQNKDTYHSILKQIANIIAELKAIRFDLIGNFEYKNQFTPKNQKPDPSADFHIKIGGIVDFPGYSIEGACDSFSEYAFHCLSYYQQEIKKLSTQGHPNRDILQKYIPILDRWLQIRDFSFLNTPDDIYVYSHQDFVMKNILIDEGLVTAVLDWEWSGSALPEFEPKTGFDFLYTDQDRDQFNTYLEERGLYHFFSPPPAERALFYRLIGKIYTLISCYEWVEGKLEHTAKFLDQKLEQRKIRNQIDFNMKDYIEKENEELEKYILEFNQRMTP